MLPLATLHARVKGHFIFLNGNVISLIRLDYTKDNVTFYLPRPFHFLSYQSNRLLRRSDLHSKHF
jgi:hypothetical protein